MKTTFTLFALLLFSAGNYAQTFPYSVSAFAEEYVEFSDGTPLITEVWEQAEFTLDFGFEMEILGNSITSMNQIGLGAVFITENSPQPLFFVPYGSPLIDAGILTGNQISTISYKLEGTENNRIGKLQYSACAFYNELMEYSTALQNINFQVWFYEADNSIEIHFGPHSITDSQLVHEDISGPSIIFASNINIYENTYDEAWVLTGSPSAPQVSEIDLIESMIAVGLDSDPDNETVIRFVPETVSLAENFAENFKVFPNPFSDQLSIDLDSQKAVGFRIYNTVGSMIMNGSFEPNENILDLSSLANGLYILHVNGEQKKIIKQ